VAETPTVESAVAERLERRASPLPGVPLALRVVRELDAIDRALYLAIAGTPTPTLDNTMRRLSDVADYSRLWMAIAAAMAGLGGRRGRRSAALGLVSIGVTSATVNLLGKHLFRRDRPDRAAAEVTPERFVDMPTSTSFPSGHSASAFAFVNAVDTGGHDPGDVVIGSLIGAAVGDAVAAARRQRVSWCG
jgi:undecaprenyl-diphosphatase